MRILNKDELNKVNGGHKHHCEHEHAEDIKHDVHKAGDQVKDFVSDTMENVGDAAHRAGKKVDKTLNKHKPG